MQEVHRILKRPRQGPGLCPGPARGGLNCLNGASIASMCRYHRSLHGLRTGSTGHQLPVVNDGCGVAQSGGTNSICQAERSAGETRPRIPAYLRRAPTPQTPRHVPSLP